MNEKQPIVSFQGEAGAYSEAAIYAFLGEQIRTFPCVNFERAFEAVTNKVCDMALLPFENSLAGSVHRNYDLSLRHDLHIVGEYHHRVSHCLLALPGVKEDEILRVHSHPQALAQCEESLDKLGAERVAEADTAGSARIIAEKNDRQAAAIASSRAAQVYGLNILANEFEDNPANYTRFLALAQNPLKTDDPETGDYKTSVVFSLDNKPGVLFKALSVFALREIDLTKIESRPITGKPWEYLFYIDFAGHADARICNRALEHLNEIAPFLRILGSYPRHRLNWNNQ